ncbi:hypothetical protein ACLOJK_017494 [Asimina triloba]
MEVENYRKPGKSLCIGLAMMVRVVNGVPPTGDYSFAKYNKSVDVLKYTDEEYEKYLTDPNITLQKSWTKEETDQLFDLCQRFDLRFIFKLIACGSHFRSLLPTVSRGLLLARASSPADVSNNPLVKESYNMSQEIERKRALSKVFTQTKQQERKDAEILAEAKRIAESRMLSKVAEEDELPIGPEGVDKAADSVSPSSNARPTAIQDSAAVPASLRMLRVYLRTYALDQMVQAASTSAGLRTTKRVEQTLQDLGSPGLKVHLKPKVPTKAVCTEHLELRKEILTLLNLQKQLQYKEAEAPGHNDNSYVETPSTPKHLHRAEQDRQFVVSDSGALGGERAVKREQKRKAPGSSLEVLFLSLVMIEKLLEACVPSPVACIDEHSKANHGNGLIVVLCISYENGAVIGSSLLIKANEFFCFCLSFLSSQHDNYGKKLEMICPVIHLDGLCKKRQNVICQSPWRNHRQALLIGTMVFCCIFLWFVIESAHVPFGCPDGNWEGKHVQSTWRCASAWAALVILLIEEEGMYKHGGEAAAIKSEVPRTCMYIVSSSSAVCLRLISPTDNEHLTNTGGVRFSSKFQKAPRKRAIEEAHRTAGTNEAPRRCRYFANNAAAARHANSKEFGVDRHF